MELLNFKRKNGEYKYTDSKREWVTKTGLYYICYPFMIYKDKDHYALTHLSSGALVCKTSYLYSAKYIATRLLPVPQFLLPTHDLVSHMTREQKSFCMDIIGRYRNENKVSVTYLDKKCPFKI